MLKNTLSRLALIALAAGFMGLANAQNLDTSANAPATDDGRPTRGMTQSRVESTYGAPVTKMTPVGEPPITRWEYQNMIVYFEYDRVIHAVLKR